MDEIQVTTIDPDFEVIEFKDVMSCFPEEDRCGIRVTSGCVTLYKDSQSLIGISIGGGVPYCPCIYIVQVFDNTVVAKDGTLQSGDEIISIDKKSVKGLNRSEVAKLIQRSRNTLTISYNKLHIEENKGRSFDIALKKFKHKVIENVSSSTADFLGWSRAVLVNDSFVKKLEFLNGMGTLFKELANLITVYNKSNSELAQVHKKMAEVFDEIGVKEPQCNASEAFTIFAKGQRCMQKYSDVAFEEIKNIVDDLKVFVNKVVPDFQLTVKKYLDAKFEYLAYCLKVKEMDDEESCYAIMNECLYRNETGNYEYRMILRYRQESRKRFAKMRNDVLIKLELVDNKHVQDIVRHLVKFMKILKQFHNENLEVWKEAQIFPIEIDISTLTNINEDFNARLKELKGFDGCDEDFCDSESEGECYTFTENAISHNNILD